MNKNNNNININDTVDDSNKSNIEVSRLFVFIENYCKSQVEIEEARHKDTPKDKLYRLIVVCLSILLALTTIITSFAYLRTIHEYEDILNGLVVIEQNNSIDSEGSLDDNKLNIIEGVDQYESD